MKRNVNVAPAIIAILVILIVALCWLSPEFAVAVYQIFICKLGPAECVRIVP